MVARILLNLQQEIITWWSCVLHCALGCNCYIRCLFIFLFFFFILFVFGRGSLTDLHTLLSTSFRMIKYPSCLWSANTRSQSQPHYPSPLKHLCITHDFLHKLIKLHYKPASVLVNLILTNSQLGPSWWPVGAYFVIFKETYCAKLNSYSGIDRKSDKIIAYLALFSREHVFPSPGKESNFPQLMLVTSLMDQTLWRDWLSPIYWVKTHLKSNSMTFHSFWCSAKGNEM